MAEFPALPLWTDALTADTEHLSDCEYGLYLRILVVMWRSPYCRIPNDDVWLARRFRRSVEDVEKTIRPLIREYIHSDGNWLTQKRLLKEWQWCKHKSQKNTDAVNSRWAKKKANYECNTPIPTPTPTPLVSKTDRTSEKKQGTRLAEDWRPNEHTKADCVAMLGLQGVADALAEFRDYWLALPGARARKLDWDRTFRNRCRMIKGRNGFHREKTLKEKTADALQKLRGEGLCELADLGLPKLKYS